VDSIAQKAGDVTPADWANVTTNFKEKELKRRQKRAENKAKGKKQKKNKIQKAKPNPKAKAQAKATTKKSKNADLPISWAVFMNREHSKVWHREVKDGMTNLGLNKEDSRARAGEAARAHVAKWRKLREEDNLPKLPCKINFGDVS
jgi:hypothetical protein